MNVKENVSTTEILNFTNYYDAGELDYGNHGPEIHDNEVYLTLYHFLQFHDIDPKDYNTLKLGAYLYAIRPNDPKCKYTKFNYAHTKHPYSFFVDYISEFNNFLN